jgi:hypothetical protein
VQRRHQLGLAAVAVTALVGTIIGATRATAAPASGATAGAAVGASAVAVAEEQESAGGYTFAVIGDIPYGSDQITKFPAVVAQINADPAVQWVVHLGDIKNGSTACSDEYFQLIKGDFDKFEDPFVYTVGDNEWTDCHRPNNGGYNPLDRLAKIRQVFFPHPGYTLGQNSAPVRSQAGLGIPEDVQWRRAGIAFATLHIVGSNNSLAPWTGKTAPTPEQTAEVLARTAAVIQEIHDTFATARVRHARAIALMTQADMFDPTVTAPPFADYYGFQPIVAAIARESAAFDRPVYLFNGDSHVFNADHPLAAGSPWLPFYGISQPVPNLSRITVDGSNNATNYLRVTVHHHGPDVLTWTRVPFTS